MAKVYNFWFLDKRSARSRGAKKKTINWTQKLPQISM
jgi:hypothetical protein